MRVDNTMPAANLRPGGGREEIKSLFFNIKTSIILVNKFSDLLFS